MRRAWIKALLLDKINDAPVVLLEIEGTNKVVPIWIGPCEAYALALALDGMKFGRPLTHDLIFNFLEALDVTIEMVVIHTVKDNTFYANIVLKDLTYGDEETGEEAPFIEIDARPSDSMILAVKGGIPIYVSNEIVNEHAVDLEGISISEGEENEDEQFKRFVGNLDIDAFRKFLEERRREEGEKGEGEGDEP